MMEIREIKDRTAWILLMLISFGLVGCSEQSSPPQPAAPETNRAQASKPKAPPLPVAPVVSKFTPMEAPDRHLGLNPLILTEENITPLIEDIRIELNRSAFQKVIFTLQYGLLLNLNLGPPGLRPTYEGSELRLMVEEVKLKDGTTLPVSDKRPSQAQRWDSENSIFNDSREVPLKSDIKKGTLASAKGEMVIKAVTGTQAFEFKRPAETTTIKVETLPIDGFKAIPFWDQRRVELRFGENGRSKIVHVRGIDEDGQELKLVSVAGLESRSDTKAGRHSYTFGNNGKKLNMLQIYLAPKTIERRIPFDVKVKEE